MDSTQLAQGMGFAGTGGVIVSLAYVLRPLILQVLQDMRQRREAAARELAELRLEVTRALSAAEEARGAARGWEDAERQCQERVQDLAAQLSAVRSRTDQVSLQVTSLLDAECSRQG